jgi:hypothetical protein
VGRDRPTITLILGPVGRHRRVPEPRPRPSGIPRRNGANMDGGHKLAVCESGPGQGPIFSGERRCGGTRWERHVEYTKRKLTTMKLKLGASSGLLTHVLFADLHSDGCIEVTIPATCLTLRILPASSDNLQTIELRLALATSEIEGSGHADWSSVREILDHCGIQNLDTL